MVIGYRVRAGPRTPVYRPRGWCGWGGAERLPARHFSEEWEGVKLLCHMNLTSPADFNYPNGARAGKLGG